MENDEPTCAIDALESRVQCTNYNIHFVSVNNNLEILNFLSII